MYPFNSNLVPFQMDEYGHHHQVLTPNIDVGSSLSRSPRLLYL